MRYLGIDYGSKRIGLALSDEAGTMGFPYAIIDNAPSLIERVAGLVREKKVGAIVIGESRTLSGNENLIARAAHAFGDALAHSAGVPVYYESEVFTSEEARQQPDREKHAHVDDSAAALILTSYLSRIFHA